MNGDALKTIYQNLFKSEPGEPDQDFRIKRFQNLAASCLKGEEGLKDFYLFLTQMNDGEDPYLESEQISAFFWLMRADQNCQTIKPWDDSDAQLW